MLCMSIKKNWKYGKTVYVFTLVRTYWQNLTSTFRVITSVEEQKLSRLCILCATLLTMVGQLRVPMRGKRGGLLFSYLCSRVEWFPSKLTFLTMLQLRNVNTHLHGLGTIWYSQSERPFLLKFIYTKIVKHLVFLVKSIVYSIWF